jgi:hypothetical protein
MFIITAASSRESMLFITVPVVRAGESMFIITAARARESMLSKTNVN